MDQFFEKTKQQIYLLLSADFLAEAVLLLAEAFLATILSLAGVVLLLVSFFLLVVLLSGPLLIISPPASIAPVTPPVAAPTAAPLTTLVTASATLLKIPGLGEFRVGAFLLELVLFLAELVVLLAEEPVLLLAAGFLSVPVFAVTEDFFESVAEDDFDKVDFLVVGAELLSGADFLVVIDDFEEGLFVFEVAISFSSNDLNS
ncbi:MAG: hypothetical protein WKF90_03310 [Pyrinomonadaceae bacterium]